MSPGNGDSDSTRNVNQPTIPPTPPDDLPSPRWVKARALEVLVWFKNKSLPDRIGIVQAVIGMVQAVIAAVMVVSLWQSCRAQQDSREAIELTKRQIECNITPIIDTEQDANILTFKNSGTITVTNMMVLTRVINHFRDSIYDDNSNVFIRTHIVITDKLLPGESKSFPLTPTNPSDSHDEFLKSTWTNSATECNCLVVRYERLTDMKPYYGFYFFSRDAHLPDGSCSTNYWVYHKNFEKPGQDAKHIRSRLKQAIFEQVDLPGYDESKSP